MAAVKTLREKMADEGLKSYIVAYDDKADDTEAEANFYGMAEPQYIQFWAEDAGHAGEQFDDAFPGYRLLVALTQAEYEARTGNKLGYGYGENV